MIEAKPMPTNLPPLDVTDEDNAAASSVIPDGDVSEIQWELHGSEAKFKCRERQLLEMMRQLDEAQEQLAALREERDEDRATIRELRDRLEDAFADGIRAAICELQPEWCNAARERVRALLGEDNGK